MCNRRFQSFLFPVTFARRHFLALTLVSPFPVRYLARSAAVQNAFALRTLLESRAQLASKPRSKFLARRVAASFQDGVSVRRAILRVADKIF